MTIQYKTTIQVQVSEEVICVIKVYDTKRGLHDATKDDLLQAGFVSTLSCDHITQFLDSKVKVIEEQAKECSALKKDLNDESYRADCLQEEVNELRAKLNELKQNQESMSMYKRRVKMLEEYVRERRAKQPISAGERRDLEATQHVAAKCLDIMMNGKVSDTDPTPKKANQEQPKDKVPEKLWVNLYEPNVAGQVITHAAHESKESAMRATDGCSVSSCCIEYVTKESAEQSAQKLVQAERDRCYRIACTLKKNLGLYDYDLRCCVEDIRNGKIPDTDPYKING